MSFLHNVSPEILNILYKGQHFQPITKYSLKSDDIGYFKNFSHACDVATVLAFHHALIEFVQKPEISKINLYYNSYPPVWNDLISYSYADEDSLKRKEKSEIKKEWELVCRRGFPYKKTPDYYTKVFGSLEEMPHNINMVKKLNKRNNNGYYFELTKENIDIYLKFLLGDEHYKFYYSSTENFLIKRSCDNNIQENTHQNNTKRNRL